MIFRKKINAQSICVQIEATIKLLYIYNFKNGVGALNLISLQLQAKSASTNDLHTM